MAYIGRVNQLQVVSTAPQGVYLEGMWLGKILLPKRYVPEGCKEGDKITVFVYLDSEDRFIATTQRPKAQVGELAFLEVKEVNKVGAFLDWGLPKDLLVPFNQQTKTMEVGKSYLVYLYSDDDTNRIAASAKLNQFIERDAEGYKQGQAVDLTIADKTDLGYSAAIDNKYWGLLFYDDVVKPLKTGQKIKGYVKRLRPDGKVDLSLQAPGFAKVEDLSVRILRELNEHQGFLPLTDKSAPELINDCFGVSKKAFKMTIGNLYKKRMITIEKDGIHLTENWHEASEPQDSAPQGRDSQGNNDA